MSDEQFAICRVCNRAVVSRLKYPGVQDFKRMCSSCRSEQQMRKRSQSARQQEEEAGGGKRVVKSPTPLEEDEREFYSDDDESYGWAWEQERE